MRRFAWMISVCSAMLVPFFARAQVRIEPQGVGRVRAAAVGPDIVASPGFVNDANGNGDGVANPGEGVFVTFSLRNSGLAATQDVRVVVASDDPRVEVGSVGGGAFFWGVGDAWTYSVSIPISFSATSGDVVSVVTVTAADGGPWHFLLTFPIVAPSVLFTREDTSVSDPTPTADGDGLAEPGERVVLSLRLRNDGAEAATNVRITLATLDPGMTVVFGEATHPAWPAGEARPTEFLLDLDPAFTKRELALFFTVVADGVVPAQFSYVLPVAVPEPDFALRNAWVFDPTPGGNRDGRAAPGERVRPRVRLRNVGTAEARNVVVTMTVADPDITVVDDRVTHAVWAPGEARNNDGLAFEVSPGAAPHDLTAAVTVTADGAGPWQFAVPFTVAEPDVSFVLESSWVYDPQPGGNRDHQANRGERVLPRVRLRNGGSDDARGVSVTLTTADPDINIASSETIHDRWAAGAARNSTGFALDISQDAQPHDATLSVTVITAQGGSWEFTVVIPIVYAAVEFARRASWIFDPAPGGDRDGQVEAGELVFPRLRLKHVGIEEARNVRVAVSTDNPEITVTAAEVTHATWAPGEARNNVGLALRVANDAVPRDVTMTATVTADNGGPWVFLRTLQVVAPPVEFVQNVVRVASIQAAAVDQPRIQMRHIGSEPAHNVRVTVVSTHPDITASTGQVTRDVWPAGEEWDGGALRLKVATDAVPQDVPLTVLVSADGGGSWEFHFVLPITRDLTFRQAGARAQFDDRIDGGDGDGRAEPGESAMLALWVMRGFAFIPRDVRATLTIDDPDVTVREAEWTIDAYTATNWFTIRGFLVEVSPTATAHAVEARISLTADHGDPWEFVVTFYIATTPPNFALRNAWVYDPAPGANRDGAANPGERVLPRVRMKNTGQQAAEDVRVTMLIDDPDVTIVSGAVTHATWPGGEARNNNGFVLDIDAGAATHDVTATVVVSADTGGPWQFSVTIPIVAPAAATALLANYPNPFNPETWIPFDLSEDADVTVNIYDVAGRSIRRLVLGRRPAGTYRGRSDAAYWDGRDDFGEPASSGVYIYELRAGASRQARRMVIRK